MGRTMKRREFTAALALGGLVGPRLLSAAPLPTMLETPSLAEKVKSSALPPVDKRIPEQPLIVTRYAGTDGIGRPGGQINILVGSARDTRLMTLY